MTSMAEVACELDSHDRGIFTSVTAMTQSTGSHDVYDR
jgi:hypothetical protein